MNCKAGRMGLACVLVVLMSSSASAAADGWRAGVAITAITPESAVWMAGYAARTRPSEGVAQQLYARALALEDRAGNRAVLVAADLLGFPRSVSSRIAKRVASEHRVPRPALMLAASHTHGGPAIRESLKIAYGLNAQQQAPVDEYSRQLEDRIVTLVGNALKRLQPVRLRLGHGYAGFAFNRRANREGQFVGGVNPDGPVDRDVPVLRVEGNDGALRAVVFGYACHNTTVGADAYRFHGDYAGWAQQTLEAHYPGSVALFVMGAGADANPYPRGTMFLARRYGEELAAAVEKVLSGDLAEVSGALRTVYEEVPLPFSVPSRIELKQRLQSDSVYVRRHAQEMLRLLASKEEFLDSYAYPIQVWRFGDDLTMVALAGEVVVDYALRLKREISADKLWVAGYTNDVFAYIPSERILKEGGYEGGGAMIYYLQPGPFATGVEEKIISKVHELIARTR